MNILSLCDGMSCGQIALVELGIKIDNYYASEIKNIAIEATQHNFPNTIQIGDVNNVTYSNGVLKTEKGDFNISFDLVIFGSPCQSFSSMMKKEMRIGLKDKIRSGLFYECYRILKEVKPKYFLMENVVMNKEERNEISKLLKVKPIRINSSLVSAQTRDRLYWTNIPNVSIPQDKHIILNDILDSGYSNKTKSGCLLVSDSRPLKSTKKMIHRYFGVGMTTLIFESKENYENIKREFERILGGGSLFCKILGFSRF